jgi:hypothetical protein
LDGVSAAALELADAVGGVPVGAGVGAVAGTAAVAAGGDATIGVGGAAGAVDAVGGRLAAAGTSTRGFKAAASSFTSTAWMGQ